ncbi:MAG: hypothetical protein J0I10_20090 [Verrucomicrobia bacterium]|nr:hypothetical protein [Verrucomicrobiota bacterium]
MRRAVLSVFALVAFGSGHLYPGEFSKATVPLDEVNPKVIEAVESMQGEKLDAKNFSAEKYVIKFGGKNWVNIKTHGLGGGGDSQLPNRAAEVDLILIQKNDGRSPRRIFYSVYGEHSLTGSYLYFQSAVPPRLETVMNGTKFSLTARNASGKGEVLYQILVEQTFAQR